MKKYKFKLGSTGNGNATADSRVEDTISASGDRISILGLIVDISVPNGTKLKGHCEAVFGNGEDTIPLKAGINYQPKKPFETVIFKIVIDEADKDQPAMQTYEAELEVLIGDGDYTQAPSDPALEASNQEIADNVILLLDKNTEILAKNNEILAKNQEMFLNQNQLFNFQTTSFLVIDYSLSGTLQSAANTTSIELNIMMPLAQYYYIELLVQPNDLETLWHIETIDFSVDLFIPNFVGDYKGIQEFKFVLPRRLVDPANYLVNITNLKGGKSALTYIVKDIKQ